MLLYERIVANRRREAVQITDGKAFVRRRWAAGCAPCRRLSNS